MSNKVSVVKGRRIFVSFYETFWGFYHLLFSHYCFFFSIKITPVSFLSSACTWNAPVLFVMTPNLLRLPFFYLRMTLLTPPPSPTYPIVLDDNLTLQQKAIPFIIYLIIIGVIENQNLETS